MDDYTTVNFTAGFSATRFGDMKREYNTTGKIVPRIKKKARGFCVNKTCQYKAEKHFFQFANKKKRYNTNDYSEVLCPHCEHALFWTKSWEKIR